MARASAASGQEGSRPADASWRIVRYVDGDSGEALYGVTRRGRRYAWGLKDRAAAERWLIRRHVPIQKQLSLEDQAAS